jgi:LysR family transcriptional regulator, chromosome initiation inhibitor
MMDLPLDQVRTLLAVVDAGTFDAAARVMSVTPSAVSQRIKALEQRTGRVLLLRSKPVRLTESGTVVVRFARQLSQLERDTRTALGMADTGEPTTLSIAVPADSLATWLMPALASVPARLRICFDLHREDQDHSKELLMEGRVMAAITSSARPVQGCTVRMLGRMAYRPVASPAFVERWLSPGPLRQTLPTTLPNAPVVHFDRKDDLQDRFVRGLAPRTSTPPIRHYVPANGAFLDAVTHGLGWGMIPRSQITTHLAEGTLVDLAPEHRVDVPLYWQQWKLDSPALAAVADAVADAIATACHGDL